MLELASMPVAIGKSFEFAAAHRLWRAEWTEEKNRDVFGKCAHHHGHNYTLEISVFGAQDPHTGMVFDASKLSSLVQKWILDDVDHKDLAKDVPWLEGKLSTVENVTEAVWERLEGPVKEAGAELYEVRVQETGRIFAVRRRND